MKVAFIGRSEIMFETIKYFLNKKIKIGFVYTCKSEDNYKKNEFDIKKLCQKHKILYFCDTKINSKLKKLKKTNVKLALSINYKARLSKNLLKLFEFGVFNAHLGDLPKFRGNATPNWAIIKQKKIYLYVFTKCLVKLMMDQLQKKFFIKLPIKLMLEIYIIG